MSKAAELAALIGSQTALSNRNLIINGAMQVAQRGTSTTGLKNTGGVFTIDRFSYRRGGTWSNLQVKHEQVDVTDTLPASAGFKKALRATCTTAEGSVPASNEATAIGYYMERGDTHRLSVGTSSMKTSTLSFYVKSSIATTFGIAIVGNQHSTNQKIKIPFTVSAANTYERISVTIPAYNVALDSDADTTAGWTIHWVLDATAATATNSVWSDSDDQGVLLPKDVSTTAFSNTLNATFEITGVQLEAGEQATPFEHRSFGDELARCQRYYQVTGKATSNYHVFPAQRFSSTKVFFSVPIATSMRGDPTLGSTTTGNIGYVAGNGQSGNFALSAVSFVNLDASSITANITVGFTPNNTKGYTGYITTGDELQFDAEL